MDEILEEIRKLKDRISRLESNKHSNLCYETLLGTFSIIDILKCKDELYIQICDYILEFNVIQIIDNKIYICHNGSWLKGNILKQLLEFVEQKWIQSYLDFISNNDDLTGEQFETYNELIYSLNIKKNLSKIKKYIIDNI